MVHDFGYLAGGSVGSMEMAVVGNEIAGMVSHVIKGVTIDDESLAVEVIKEVGPGGHFLSHKHTLKLFEREVQPTNLFDRGSEGEWVKAGSKDIRQIANVRVKKILKEHAPDPLPNHIKEKITNIVKKAEKELI
jgi:trimethylamine--corrinoid protein Co-methyltransferase